MIDLHDRRRNAIMLHFSFTVIVVMCSLRSGVGESGMWTKSVCESGNLTSSNRHVSCNQQLPVSSKNATVIEGSCWIRNTSYCKAFDKSEWIEKKHLLGANKKEFVLDVGVSLYTQKLVGNYSFLKVPSFNITVNINATDVTGFMLKVSEEPTGYNICRVFDFRTLDLASLIERNSQVTFWYDCVWLKPSSVGKIFTIMVIQLPQFVVWTYTVKILHFDNIEPEDSTKWESLIGFNSANAWFVPAPQKYNFTDYRIELIELDSGTVKDNFVVHVWPEFYEVPNRVKFIEFQGRALLDPGKNYTITVQALDGICIDSTCAISESALFVFSQIDEHGSFFEAHYLAVALAASGMTLIIICLVASLFTVRRRRLKRFSKDFDKENKPRVLLLYSYDHPLHFNVVESIADYLQNRCFCDVLMDSRHIKNQDPANWMINMATQADFVLIVWSKGAHLKCDPKNKFVINNERTFMGGDLFSLAMETLSSENARRLQLPKLLRETSRFCLLTLPYSTGLSTRNFKLPSTKVFKIPGQFSKLFNFVHKLNPDFNSPLLGACAKPQFESESTEEFEELLRAIAEMEMLERNLPNWFKPLLVEQTRGRSENRSKPITIDKDSSSEPLLSDDQRDLIAEFRDRSISLSYLEDSFPPPMHDLPKLSDLYRH